MEKFLKECGMKKYRELFQEHNINEDALQLVDKQTLKEIIPTIGDWLKIWRGITEVLESEDSFLEDEPMQTPNALKRKQPTLEERSLNSSIFSPRANIGAAPDGLKYVGEMESGLLSFSTRKEIVRLLGSWLIEKFSPDECKPPSHAKIKLAKALIEEFSLLRDSDGAGFEAWYSPAKGKKEATGYIEYRIRNVRRRALKKAPVIKTFSPASSLENNLAEELAGDKDGEDLLEKKEWLKYNTEPIKLVDSYMAATAKHRCQWIRENTDVPVSSILDEYPRLLLLDGKYIQQDFRILYPSNCDKMFMKWSTMAPKIIKYADAQDGGRWRRQADVVKSEKQETNAAFYALSAISPPGLKKESNHGKNVY